MNGYGMTWSAEIFNGMWADLQVSRALVDGPDGRGEYREVRQPFADGLRTVGYIRFDGLSYRGYTLDGTELVIPTGFGPIRARFDSPKDAAEYVIDRCGVLTGVLAS